MNPLRLLVLLVSLPLLLGGCGGEKKEPVGEVGPVEEKQEVKEEVKPEEPIAETKPKLEGVNVEEIEEREGIIYLNGSDTPYTGKSYALYPNGQKMTEGNYKNGKKDGLDVWWHLNGQKRYELNIKDGKQISKKWWNNKGEPVDSFEEVFKE